MIADNGLRGNITEQDREQYEQRWTDFMVKFWQEKMMKFSPPVYDRGALYHSLVGVLHPGSPTTIEHRFLEYGIYVAAGTGNGYRRGNSGKDDENGLQFLRGKKWNKGKGHRHRRDWFAKKYLYRILRLNDFEATFYGQAYQGLLSDALSAMFGDSSALARHNNGNNKAAMALGNL
ncbi:MAG: hypothetical protein ACOCOR_07325 [Prevotella sp.]